MKRFWVSAGLEPCEGGYRITLDGRPIRTQAGGAPQVVPARALAEALAAEWQAQGEEVEVCAIGNKGLGFMQRLGASIVSHVVQLGDRPQMDKLIGAVKVMLDGYTSDRFDRLMIAYTRFVNTMKQEPVIEQLLPLSGERLGAPETVWDYLYEPEARAVLDQVMTRYIEALIFQAVSENMASEQSARMVAMKAASDNAATLIDELTLIYNKNRQAGITKELSEIVGGAAAV